jgi:NitT/TauT family transport system substrate-binding protein
MKKVLAVFLIFFCFLGKGSAAGEQSKKVRLGYLQNDLHQLPCWVAIDKGLYSSQGLDVEVAGIFNAGPEEMSAFASGSLDIGYVGVAPATTAVANKAADVVVLAQVNKEGSAVVVENASPILQVSDLRGKYVAVPGHAQVQDFLLRKALIVNGVDMNEVHILVLKPPEMIPALRTSQIDAFVAWEPYPSKAVGMGVGRIFLSSSDIWKGHPCCVLVAESKFTKDRARTRSIVMAHVKAIAFIRDHPEEALRIGAKYTGMDENTVRSAMTNIRYDCVLESKDFLEYATFLSRVGYIRIPDPNSFIKGFVQDGILSEILLR